MLVITIILGIVALVFTSRYFLLKKDLKILNKDIIYRFKKESKANLVTNSSSKEIEELIYAINNLFLKKEEVELEYRKIDQELKENIANISHDLRTPLTAILGYCDLLSKSNLTTESREYVHIINKKSKVLHQLVDDFYDFSRIISKDYPINLECINVGDLLKEVLFEYYEDFVHSTSQLDIEIPDEDIKVISDADALRRIFSNLISNMLHHGTGEYKIRLYKREKNVCISFENQVMFMDIASMERIFERSYTMNSSRSSSRSGLGLSIVKELVYRLNHDLEPSLEDKIFKIEMILKMET
ncbi:HAMP domain-containing sensor histidine kinase [Hathewaya histolytica]|uniref:histidine kinase n=1 Tax=Hathewaya histolytica TaxID=1498 RepID=A0A4U9R2X6_HATHI|nr:HAMP domain-containing sensor histidine kinase [Hathewaya histolytica]VTQ85366.1 sensor signal transduction histidine kinase [Hathewaya histolytica]